MKLYANLLAIRVAVPAFAQTETTEPAEPAKNSETSMEEMSNRTGSVYFSDQEMTTMRSSDEIQAQWSTLSVEDQDAIRARCNEVMAA